MNDIEYERLIDKRVQARLKTDRAYLNAADPVAAAEREIEIEEQEMAALDATIAERGA